MQTRSACPVLGVRGSSAIFRLYQNKLPQMKQLKMSFYLLSLYLFIYLWVGSGGRTQVGGSFLGLALFLHVQGQLVRVSKMASSSCVVGGIGSGPGLCS